MITDAEADREYHTARVRFVFDDFDHEGVRHARITDPVTGLSAHCVIDQRTALLSYFRSMWIEKMLRGTSHTG